MRICSSLCFCFHSSQFFRLFLKIIQPRAQLLPVFVFLLQSFTRLRRLCLNFVPADFFYWRSLCWGVCRGAFPLTGSPSARPVQVHELCRDPTFPLVAISWVGYDLSRQFRTRQRPTSRAHPWGVPHELPFPTHWEVRRWTADTPDTPRPELIHLWYTADTPRPEPFPGLLR